jgi:hypothetical protein
MITRDRRDAIRVIEKVADMELVNSRRGGKPGEYIQKLRPEIRAKLAELKSDDLANTRYPFYR